MAYDCFMQGSIPVWPSAVQRQQCEPQYKKAGLEDLPSHQQNLESFIDDAFFSFQQGHLARLNAVAGLETIDV